MRIGALSLDGNLPRYGIGLAVTRLCGALAAAGHDVVLGCRPACAAAVAPAPGVRVVGLGRPRRWLLRRSWAATARAALAPGVDVVHVHGLARLAWWVRGAATRGGAPLVLTAHASDELGPSASAAGAAPARRARRHAAQVRTILQRADAVIAPSRFMADLVEAASGRRAVVIGLGPTDDAPVPPPRRAGAGLAVLVLARLVPVKGVDVLVDALAATGRPDVTLRVAGDGPERRALEARAAACGVGDRVRFLGYVEGDARRAALADADVVAVPTRGAYETFGLAALDGLAAGRPVLVADGGALPERVEAGGGRVLPSGDVGAWAAALREWAEDPAAREAHAAAARRAAARAAWGHVAAAHARLYAEVRGAATGTPSFTGSA